MDHHHECLSFRIFLFSFGSSHAVQDKILKRNMYFCLYNACQYHFNSLFYTCNKNDNHFLSFAVVDMFCYCVLWIHTLGAFSDFESSSLLLFFVIIIVSEHISLHIEKSSKILPRATSSLLIHFCLLLDSSTNKFLFSSSHPPSSYFIFSPGSFFLMVQWFSFFYDSGAFLLSLMSHANIGC